MEKNIWIIKSIHDFRGKEVINDVYAVTSEEQANKDVLRFNEKAKDECMDEDYKIWYIYTKISLFD